MKFSTTLAFLSIAIAVSAHELPSRYAEQRRGNQFVSGPCKVDSDCQQGCCGFNTGKCAGPAFAQEAFGGCGHSNKHPNCNVAAALKLDDCVKGAVNDDLSNADIQKAAAFVAKLDGLKFTPTTKSTTKAPPKQDNAGSKPSKTSSSSSSGGGTKSISALAAKQSSLKFVTESCKNDSECQQGCCAFNTGKCAGPGIAQTRDGGCGKQSAKPNCNVATALNLGVCAKGATKNASDVKSAKVQQAAAFVSILDKLPFKPQ